jgi:hypothetical protein
MNPNVRKQNEKQSAFRARRKAEQKAEKLRSKGRTIWDSQQRGTYERAKHGAL